MYKINSKVDVPDTQYLFNAVQGMMKRGIKVGNLTSLYAKCVVNMNAYIDDIREKYGILNPNSSAQVINYMNGLNDPEIVNICCEKGKWTSNKQALQSVASLGYTFAEDIIAYRTLKKYADSIKGIMDVKDSNSRIHPSVSLTKTNRISYSGPALMNIPKELLWDAVVPSEPDNVLISADIKNQEPNILINMNNITSLKSALYSDNGLYETIFSKIPVYGRMNIIVCEDEPVGILDNSELRERGNIPPIFYEPKICPMPAIKVDGESVTMIDVINFVIRPGKLTELPNTIFVQTESGKIHELPISFNLDNLKASDKKKLKTFGVVEVDGLIGGLTMDCTGNTRKEFKRAWNAMTYGASLLGVKEMCKEIDGKMVYKFFTGIPELAEYRKQCGKKAESLCQETETYFGTKLVANEFNSKALKRVLLDLPIQGTAADILSLLVKHFNEEVEARGLTGKLSIYYTRHDELIIEATKELIDEIGIDAVVEIIRDLTEHQVDDWVPFKVDVEVIKEVSIKNILERSNEEE